MLVEILQELPYMKARKVISGLLVGILVLTVNCGEEDFGLIVCDKCPDVTPWSVWSIDLRHPCFPTKQECQVWADGQLMGSECMKCNK